MSGALVGHRSQKLFMVLRQLERYGAGRQVTRVNWPQEDSALPQTNQALPQTNQGCTSYWTITRVIPKQVGPL